ncbi:unnamed protein product [Didymodactylos carnosus]|uniref:Oxysterol-binding protein n=1 Tax=Didymodactylos carnosus TaxID=1234261 RepID=A0A8S2GU70_9BILA|nr:unnamed protein product [Didymodactylos carnosus]CAF3562610.1 unnamed protein product [Didymodactylos carnosus]
MEGPLSKWTNVIQGWQYRWFVLNASKGMLVYYTSKENMVKGDRRGVVLLKGANLGINSEDDSTFTIRSHGKTFHFQARDAEERQKWITGLEEAISLNTVYTDKLSVSCTSVFERKISEADAYLRLLIEQVNDLAQSMNQAQDEKERECYKRVVVSANRLIEAVKYSIVSLQLAKIHMDPNNTAKAKVDYQAVLSHMNVHKDEIVHNRSYPSLTSAAGDDSQTKDKRTNKTFGSLDYRTVVDNFRKSFPVVSYSSSDDDDFYDANDSNEYSSSNSLNLEILPPSAPPSSPIIKSSDIQPLTKSLMQITDENANINNGNEINTTMKNEHYATVDEQNETSSHNLSFSPQQPRSPLSSSTRNQIPYDIYEAGYEEDGDVDLAQMDGSVISHLISQVRLGMDLTKVTLPTFILERRSFLEMLADFLAHPDQFVSVADCTSPRDRFTHVVKWYLSAFHAGRKSPVPKKPYNPILGETFQCYYDVGSSTSTKNTTNVSDGPVPWANRDNVTFIAEQVSHHPPVAAFYAECVAKRIQLDGCLWTKSKFLGLSIAVHMIGDATLTLLDFDEKYVMTFPSAYGRSILGVPWFEMGGKVQIDCEKSGHSATIDFLTKPFYNGKKHQITGVMYGPDKKEFCKIDGEWNGVMYAKYTESKISDVFFDTHNTPIIKKIVRPIKEQGEYESRHLWKDVTYCLKSKQLEKATDAKLLLEQRQREEAKERAEKSLKWQTKDKKERPEWLTKYESKIDKVIEALKTTNITQFQSEKIEEFRRVFDLFDKDGSGSIDSQEIGQLMRSLGQNPTNKQIEDLISQADKNGNQRLDFNEFVEFMSAHWNDRDQADELKEAFRLFDKDNSGYLTINELKQVMLNMGEKLSQEELDDMMREADLNHDGKLDYHEFVRTLLSIN